MSVKWSSPRADTFRVPILHSIMRIAASKCQIIALLWLVVIAPVSFADGAGLEEAEAIQRLGDDALLVEAVLLDPK